MNSTDRLVFATSRFDHVTPLLRQLLCLKAPERERIEFELAILVYRCLHRTAPLYFAGELHRSANSEARQRLCSASSTSLSAVHVSQPSVTEPSRSLVLVRGTLCHSLFSILLYHLISSFLQSDEDLSLQTLLLHPTFIIYVAPAHWRSSFRIL